MHSSRHRKTVHSSAACHMLISATLCWQVDEFLRRCGGGGSSSGGSGKQKAPADWGACVLLFTAKHKTSPLALSLANQYR